MLALNPEAASATFVNELTLSTGNEYADGLYLHTREGADALIVTSTSFGGYWGYWESSYPFMGRTSTIRRIDVTNPASASMNEALTLEGQIISSRRVEDHLYVATRFYPDIPGVEPYLTDEPTARAVIEQAEIMDLLPSVTRASDDSVSALADASDCFVAPANQDGYRSPDIVTIVAINLVTMDVDGSFCFLGATETLYATPSSIYLATTRYSTSVFGDTSVSPIGPGDEVPERDPRTSTDIHRFVIDTGNVSYAGSGEVEGHLGWIERQRPFRLSERSGHLSVITHNDDQSGAVSPVLVSVLEADTDGTLARVGRLPNSVRPEPIGKPREQLHATRFVDERAFLVTFLQTDPLYVIDLATPADPRIAGALEIDGYSDYLHPIGEDYLLGIGKGAIPAPGGAEGAERGAFAQGVKLTLFDVSNPATPREVQSIEIGRRGTQATALQDHHGITVQSANADRPTRVAFGIDVADVPPDVGVEGPATWYGWSRTGLHAFEIATGVNAGIAAHGDMIVERRSEAQSWGPLRYNDRSVIVGDAVYYVHGEHVYAASWNGLNNITGPE